MDIEIGGDTFTKKPNILEEIAYRDTWGKGADSFIAMIYERLMLMRDLLAEDGSIYVHCDWRVNRLHPSCLGRSLWRPNIFEMKSCGNDALAVTIHESNRFGISTDTHFLLCEIREHRTDSSIQQVRSRVPRLY